VDALVHAALSNAAAAALLAAVLIPAARLLRRPALTHLLCVLVLLKLVTPPLFSLPLRWLPAPAAEPPREVAPASVPLPFALDDVPLAEEVTETSALAAADSPTSPLPTPPQPTSPAAAPPWGVLLLAAWSLGSLLYVGAILCGVLSLGRALRLATPAPPEVRRQVRVLARRLGLRHCPSTWFVPGGMCPLLVAVFWRPRLLLPVRFWQRLDAVQREGVLLHELAHYRRRDHWVRVLELAVAVLYWWHPAAWWARREMREAEEQCCDAWVVWSMPQAVRQYMSTLLEAVDLSSEPFSVNGATRGGGPKPAAAVAMLSSGMGFPGGLGRACQFHRLERRLTMIKRREVNRKLSSGGLAAVCGLAVLLPLGPTLVRAESPEDKGRVEQAEPAAKAEKTEESARQEPASEDRDRQRKAAEAEAASVRGQVQQQREQAEQQREQAEKARDEAREQRERAREQAERAREQAREQAAKAREEAMEQVARAREQAAEAKAKAREQAAKADAIRRAREEIDDLDAAAGRRGEGEAERKDKLRQDADAYRDALKRGTARRNGVGEGDGAEATEKEMADLQRAMRDLERQMRQLQERRSFLEEAMRSSKSVPPTSATPGRRAKPARPAEPAEPAKPAEPADPARPGATPRPTRGQERDQREQFMLRVEGEELQAIDSRSGKKLWTFNVGGEPLPPVVLDGRRVSVKRTDGKTFILDLRTGKVQGENSGAGGRN
jgi:beta-lactamase regulating signal transducer with metallopeptidase domain